MDPKTEPLYAPNVVANRQKLQKLQDVMALSLGVAAGALGLESLYGFAFFLAGHTLANVSFYHICCGPDAALFFENPTKEVFVDGVFTGVAGFVMMWCLTYALVR